MNNHWPKDIHHNHPDYSHDELNEIYEYSEPDISVDPSKAWSGINEKLTTDSRNYAVWLKVAAAIIVMISAGYAYFSLFQSSHFETLASGDKVHSYRLKDGSKVTLDKNTTMLIASNFTANREVILQNGTAYFEVEKQKSPFIVKSEDILVRVIGTEFMVTKNEVLVDHGKVEVSTDNSTKILSDGDHILAGADGFEYVKNPTVLTWKTDEFVFLSTPFSSVVDILESHFKVNVEFPREMSNCLVSGTITSKEISETLALLEKVVGFESTIKNSLIAISGEGCK